MGEEQDHFNNDKLLIIDVFMEKDNEFNYDCFLNKPTNESFTIADIYITEDMIKEANGNKINNNAVEEKFEPQKENKASMARLNLPDFIKIGNEHSNSHILYGINQVSDKVKAHGVSKLTGQNRSVLRKILPKTNSIILSSGKANIDPSSVITYKCVVCPLIFIDFKNFQAHLKEHYELHYFSCEECPECFSNKPELFDHIKKTHSYNIIKRPEKLIKNAQNIEVIKVAPYSSLESMEFMENLYEDVEPFCDSEINDDEGVNFFNTCDDSFITLEEAREMQMKMEEEELNLKKKRRF